MKNVDKSRMAHHRSRADAFFETMDLVSDDPSTYGPAVPLLAVHTAISYTDAVLVGHGAGRSSDQDHKAVVKPIRELCNKLGLSTDGLKHLIWLLSRKSDFAYGDKPITLEEVQLAATKAERYQAWVYQSFPTISGDDQSTH
jgi:hypothetical protein